VTWSRRSRQPLSSRPWSPCSRITCRHLRGLSPLVKVPC